MIYNFLKLFKVGDAGSKCLCSTLLILSISSCATKRNLTYMSDMGDTAIYRSHISNLIGPHLKSGDILSINITNVDPETSTLLNKGLLPVVNSAVPANNYIIADVPGYLIDNNGYITYPVIGKIQLDGLTIEQAIDKLSHSLGSFVKVPIITIKLLNFKITVIGEVNKPGVFSIPNSRVNVLEALGLAGDMTVYGKREDVQVIHEENGIRTVSRIDLNSKSLLQSPVFYLQQNDVIYIRPDKLKERQARTDTRTLSIVVAAATIITVIISRLF